MRTAYLLIVLPQQGNRIDRDVDGSHLNQEAMKRVLIPAFEGMDCNSDNCLVATMLTIQDKKKSPTTILWGCHDDP